MGLLLDSIRQDFGYALRQLRRSPGFTTAAVACLAIGVWLACVVSAVGRGMYRPENGFARPDRVVQVDVVGEFRDYQSVRVVSRSVLEGLRNAQIFSAIGDYDRAAFQLADDIRQHPVTFLSPGMFGVFGIRPHIGRPFVPGEEVRGAGDVVLLSYDFWQRQFGGDSGVLGRQLRLTRPPRQATVPAQTIVGVMPAGFNFPARSRPDLYAANGSQIAYPSVDRKTIKIMLARLRDDRTIEQADGLARNLANRNLTADREEQAANIRATGRHHTPLPGPIQVRAVHYYAEPWGERTDRLMALVIACGFGVVLIACANVANLLLVRGAARRQEIAVRMALGASRSRIVMQLIAESVLLSVSGAAVGFLLAFWHWRLFDSTFVLRHIFGQIDRYAALTAAILGVVLVAIFGLLPALRASSMRLEQVLRDSRRSEMGATRLDGLMARLIIASTAGTVVLLSSAALFGLSARELLQRHRFQTENVLAVDVSFDRRLAQFQMARQAMRTLEDLSSREGARASAIGPSVGRPSTMRVTPVGRTPVTLMTAEVRSITGGYFSTLGVPLVAGRTFSPSESRDGDGVVIVGAALARQVWPGESAVGKVARFTPYGDSVGTLATVVGVATDVTIRGDGSPSLEMYFPFGLNPSSYTQALVRFNTERNMDRAALVKVRGAETGTIIGEVMSLDQRARRYNIFRYVYIGFALFAGAGLILVTVGLYGVIAFSVARRTHEIGVRLALGADGRDVRWMVTRQGLRMTLLGTAIGLAVSFGSAQLLRAGMPDVDPADPRVLIGIIGVVIVVSLVASYLPSRRAAKLDPMNALRAE